MIMLCSCANLFPHFPSDIDECKEGKDGCDKASTTCFNYPGNFRCDCKYGYMAKDRYSCQRKWKRIQVIIKKFFRSTNCLSNMLLDQITNFFQVAMRPFINRSPMMSQCDKNKLICTRGISKCVTHVAGYFTLKPSVIHF